MQRLSLTQRVFLITVVSVLPTVIIIVMNLLTIRAEREAELHEAAGQAARSAAAELERIIGGAEAVLRTVAAAPLSDHGDAQACRVVLSRITAALPQLLGIAIFDGVDRLHCGSVGNMPRSHSESRLVAAARLSGQRVIGTLAQGAGGGLPVAIAMGPAADIDGGVAVAMLDLRWLGERLTEHGQPDGASLTIADTDGRILMRAPFPEKFVGTTIPEPYRDLVHAAAPGSLNIVSQDGTARILAYLPAAQRPAPGLYISAGLPTADAHAMINMVTLRGILIAATGLAAAFLLAQATSNVFIRRPYNRLIATIEAWQRDDHSPRTGLGSELAEFGRAGRALDGFMDMLTAARAERRAAEAQRELLMRELDHRVKNLLATVQAVARQTFRDTEQDGASRAFGERLAAMAKAHRLLMGDAWQGVHIDDLVATAVGPFERAEQWRFTLTGPRFAVDARAAMALSMGLHELCTNAAKYGALSNATGRVLIEWRTCATEGSGFGLVWRETGGPPVAPPVRRGFGSTMIEQVMATQIGGEVTVTHDPAGLICRITAPMDRLRHTEGQSQPTPAAGQPKPQAS